MDGPGAFGRLAASIERERLALGRDATASPAAAELVLEEIWASTRLAGAPLSRAEVGALLARRAAVGDHRLDAYVLVADYAVAAAYVREAPGVAGGRAHLRAEEIVELHARATRRASDDRPGAWRSTTLAPFPSGMVAPPAWLVPREIARFVERLEAGPPRDVAAVLWVAEAHARFERIQPFATANGRVGRLVANLLLRRVGLPPLIISGRDAARYVPALRRADARDPWPLALLVARSIRAALLRLAAARRTAGELAPLASLTKADERAAFYKAAQRGRLSTIRRGGTLYSTQAWVDDYRASARAPRRAQPGERDA